MNFFSDTPDVVSTPSWRRIPTIPAAVPCSDLSHATLRTVEVTTAAKIYLESHFSQLLRFPNSRSVRRRKFENQLQKSELSYNERSILREEWMKKETAYLRSLRSQSLNVDNYEIVKVIGKGAFGVVKLVRERDRVASWHDLWTLENRQQYPDVPTDHTGGPREKKNQSEDPNGCHILLSESTAHVPQLIDGITQPKVYALKVMQKEDMLLGGQEGHLRAERDFLVASQGSKWIVPLVAAFQDQENLYLVMEYLIGGDLLALLIKRTVLTEEETRFYAAEMICCIEEAHALGYIHRDVKPDNFLFNSQGHLKLCDFGLTFSGHRTHDSEYLDKRRHSLLESVGILVEGDTIDRKESRRLLHNLNESMSFEASQTEEDNKPTSWLKTDRGLARSIVGTNQYMAPEVVRGDAYDGRCDWWSLGIIIYECLYGFTPFNAGNRSETRQKILNWRNTLTFPLEPKISPQAYHLVASLLCEKQHRLTAKAYAQNGFHARNDHSEGVNGYGGYIAFNDILLQEERAANRADRIVQRAIHVLPHDGMEVRAHPFFKGIDWQKLHTITPPFVPEGLNGADDTKYFEEESYQSTSIVSNSANQQLPQPNFSDVHETQPPEQNNELNMKKRARDKLLRDPIHGKELLELRKEVAFWGYTYRRPKTLDPRASEVTGRRRVTLAGSARAHYAAPGRPLHGAARTNETRDGANSGEYSGTTLDGEESEL
ncbi:kinase-like domain-containing protein [Terfezia claveryi]|nr:kinase-like domain-containing protein [Terfezia claveryi]